MAASHPDVEIVALCDEQPDRTVQIARELQLESDRIFQDADACLQTSQPDVVLLCPSAAGQAHWVEKVAAHRVHIFLEKPFGTSVEEADRMISAASAGGGRLGIHWPMAWYPTNRTAKRLIDQGAIGTVMEVHYYDGNRGPLWHSTGKAERTAEDVERKKPSSWFYSREHGGGSLLDYLGYGTTLATWFHGAQVPLEVIAMVDEPAGLEVDEHAIAVARYETGLSKFETRWGTFTDPWTHQPQPKCGFVMVGSEGTISSYDFEESVTLQNRKHPAGIEILVDQLTSPASNAFEYFLDRIQNELPLEGPLSPEISRIGQQIVDAAILSSQSKSSVKMAEMDST